MAANPRIITYLQRCQWQRHSYLEIKSGRPSTSAPPATWQGQQLDQEPCWTTIDSDILADNLTEKTDSIDPPCLRPPPAVPARFPARTAASPPPVDRGNIAGGFQEGSWLGTAVRREQAPRHTSAVISRSDGARSSLSKTNHGVLKRALQSHCTRPKAGGGYAPPVIALSMTLL